MDFFTKHSWMIISIIAAVIVAILYFNSRDERVLFMGLFLLFVLREGREPNQDEKVKSIFFSSAYYGILLALLAYFVIDMFFGMELTTIRFLIVLFAAINIIYYSRQYLIPALGLNKRKSFH